MTDKLKLKVLIDNNAHPSDNCLLTEHGLSIYFELGGCKYLFDTGNSASFFQNALKLNVDIKAIDFLFISHAHADHTGGLLKFLEVNEKAKVYLSAKASGKKYYSKKLGQSRDISMPYITDEVFDSRFIPVDKNIQLTDHIKIVTEFGNSHSLPKGNRNLYAGLNSIEELDNFNHEMALVLKIGNKFVILSACTHNGLLNTLKSCITDTDGNKYLRAYIGGTHLLDADSLNTYESDADIVALSQFLLDNYPNMKLITGHCTGSNAVASFHSKMKDNLQLFYSGFEYTL